METKNLTSKAEITVDTTVDKVWEALITPSIIKEYMFGTNVASGWTKGSAITWKGEMNGKRYEDKGEILQIEPGKRLQYSHYSPGSKLADTPENYHTVTLDLTAEKDRTHIILTQDKNGSEKEQKESEKNWTVMLQGLKKVLEK